MGFCSVAPSILRFQNRDRGRRQPDFLLKLCILRSCSSQLPVRFAPEIAKRLRDAWCTRKIGAIGKTSVSMAALINKCISRRMPESLTIYE